MTFVLSQNQGIFRLSAVLGFKGVVLANYSSHLQKIHPCRSSHEICLLEYQEKQTIFRVLPWPELIFFEMGFCHVILFVTNLRLECDNWMYLEFRHKFLEGQTQDCNPQPSRAKNCSWERVGTTRTVRENSIKVCLVSPCFSLQQRQDSCSTCWNCWAANFWCLSRYLAAWLSRAHLLRFIWCCTHNNQFRDCARAHCESCFEAAYVLAVLKWKSAGVGSCKQSCVYKIHFLATPLNWEQLILTKQKQTGKRHGPERHSQPDLSNNRVYLLTLFYSINNYWSKTVLLGYWKSLQLQGKKCILLTVLLAQQFTFYLYWLWCERRKWKRM